MKPKVLAIEDCPQNRLLIEFSLKKDFEVLLAEDGSQGLKTLNNHTVDLILVDLILPDIDGLEVCKKLKSQPQFSKIPLIVVTGKEQISVLEECFEIGVEDYITKPLHPRELLARVKSKSKPIISSNNSHIQFENIHLDTKTRIVFINKSPSSSPLTPIEYSLFKVFLSHPYQVFSRSQLLDNIDHQNLEISERIIDSHIAKIRRKIKGANILIDPVHGVGYRMIAKKDIQSKKAS